MPGCPGRRRWRSPTPAAHPPPSPSRSAPPDARYRPARSAVYAACSYSYFLVPQRLRVDHLAQQLQLVSGGKPRLPDLVQIVHRERGVLCYLFRCDARMQRHRPHLMIRPVEVEDPEIGHHLVHIDKAVRRVVTIDLVPADARHDVERIAEHPLGVVADPVARRVIDRVAWRAADTEHLPGRVLQRPERREVLIAETVNLIGPHDHMTTPPRQRLEDPAERHPTF